MMALSARVVSVQASPVGGVPRPPVERIYVEHDGVRGDKIRHTNVHGGPDQAVCLYDVETYRQLESEGMRVYPGAFAENITTEGIDFFALAPGHRLWIGESVLLEISRPRVPCNQLKVIDMRLPEAILGRSGWKARVLAPGWILPGDPIVLELPRLASQLLFSFLGKLAGSP